MYKPGIGTIKGRSVKKNRAGKKPVRLLQTQITAKDDVQTVEQLRQAGFDSGPLDESRVFYLQISPSWKVAIGIDDGITPEADPGELILYSNLSGTKAATITLKTDGSIDISASAGLNLTGDLSVTGAISATGDVVADSAITAISLLNHTHLGNLGFDTVKPTVGAPIAAPATPPSTNASGDIIGGDGVNLSTHTHTQPPDSNGDTEQPTSTPV